MSTIDETKFGELRAAFIREYKRIEPIDRIRPLTLNLDLRKEYKAEIVKTYNDLVRFLTDRRYSGDRIATLDKIGPLYDKVKTSFEKLRLEYNWPTSPLSLIVLSSIIDTTPETSTESQVYDQAHANTLHEKFKETEQICLRYETGEVELPETDEINTLIKKIVTDYNDTVTYLEKHISSFTSINVASVHALIKRRFESVKRCANSLRHTIATPVNIFSKISESQFAIIEEIDNEDTPTNPESSIITTESHGAWGIQTTNQTEQIYPSLDFTITTTSTSTTTTTTKTTTIATTTGGTQTSQTTQTRPRTTAEIPQTTTGTPQQIDTTIANTENRPPPPNQNNLNNQERRTAPRTMDKNAFISLMAANIRKNYAGDPLALTPFIASIDLLKEVADGDNGLLNLLRKFILTKLEGYASEIVPREPQNVDEIVNALKNKIKAESSEVIEGKMMALRADRVPLQDFAKKTEELADALRRALVMEDISLERAEKETIKRTIKVCRANTQNTLVKSVLESTRFDSPKEVIATYIIQAGKAKEEAQVLAVRKFGRRNQNYGNRSGNNNNRNGVQRQYNNNNNYNNNNRNFNNNRRNYNNNRPNRGGRNNYNNYNNQNNNNNYNRQNNNNRRNNNTRNVRRAENMGAPQSTLGNADEN